MALCPRLTSDVLSAGMGNKLREGRAGEARRAGEAAVDTPRVFSTSNCKIMAASCGMRVCAYRVELPCQRVATQDLLLRKHSESRCSLLPTSSFATTPALRRRVPSRPTQRPSESRGQVVYGSGANGTQGMHVKDATRPHPVNVHGGRRKYQGR
eukprot:345812-Amphidinium_carterae.1